jgi:hypothetical protein
MTTIKLLFLSIISYVLCCDISVHMSDCINKKRNIYFYNNCPKDLSVPKSLINTNCGDLKCPEGTFITYSIQEKKQVCQKCPPNTYSTGTLFRICGTRREWSRRKLEGFKNFCFIGNYEDKNHTCLPWTINKYNSRLVAGGTNVTDVWYTAVLTRNVKLNFDGFVIIT